MTIEIYKDKNTKFETNDFLKKIFDFVLIPILNSLPKSFQPGIKKTHKAAGKIIETATSYNALEVLYGHGKMYKSRNLLQVFFRWVWLTRNNAKAVRNRLVVVENELRKAVNNLIKKSENINLLSIASGSARAIVESFARVNVPESIDVSISFLDKSENALEYSKRLALSLPNKFFTRWIEDTASNFPKYFHDENKPNIIEMVGLLDYFDNEKVQSIFKIIYDNMQIGGTFITASIVDNSERKFVTNVVGWKMIYREPKIIFELAKKAGFKEENIKIFFEPLKIHFVMIAKK
ncbi:MAG: class I SAM-dependent methyltransferase family protein [Candidatus Paceibacterota bacterium]